jgi:hypothetical protein
MVGFGRQVRATVPHRHAGMALFDMSCADARNCPPAALIRSVGFSYHEPTLATPICWSSVKLSSMCQLSVMRPL